MDIQSYVFSVILAAIVSGVLLSLIKSKSTTGTLIKLLAGVFLALTVISPWKKFQISDFSKIFEELESASASSVYAGEQAYNDALRTSIIEQTESYILEKASLQGANISATVTLSSNDPPIPIAVDISGNVSPYAKNQLKNMIANDLGVPEDAQSWK